MSSGGGAPSYYGEHVPDVRYSNERGGAEAQNLLPDNPAGPQYEMTTRNGGSSASPRITSSHARVQGNLILPLFTVKWCMLLRMILPSDMVKSVSRQSIHNVRHIPTVHGRRQYHAQSPND